MRVGETHQCAKLTDDTIRRIRFLRGYNPMQWTYRRLALEFECSESHVRNIIKQKTRAS